MQDDKRKCLLLERRQRHRAEREVRQLRAQISVLGSPPGDKAGVFAMAPAFPQEPVDRALSLHPIRVPPVPLTGEMLRRLGEASRAGDVVPGSSAVEVLHWKRLVEQKERQFMKKENDEERGGKITQGLYSASDARHQFQSAARARQALIRESQGTFSLGAQVLE
ncbi:unnamed protein product [Polarella glacialis]|uniref:Uncharacterized protein n=1 Tax=Polarella glacialis TaxID=89957 RepID=A0A813GD32_POLGL|nr:unnamed protein product [Polarella glacialis]